MSQASPPPSLVRRALTQPGHALRVAVALARGAWYRRWCRLVGVRFSAGRNLRIHGRLRVRGPGEVRFGDDVTVHGYVTPWTYAREARITVGDGVILGGSRFGCVRAITVGRLCIIAGANIMDTDFHSTRADRRSLAAPVRVAPVVIGDNVWVADKAGILPGTRIGENSVVSFGAVCTREYPANVVIAGNPARVVSPIPPLPDAPAPPAGAAEPAPDIEGEKAAR